MASWATGVGQHLRVRGWTKLRRGFRTARSRMVVQEPIAPIRDHFLEADRLAQGTKGCLTVSALVRSFRTVRRERRHPSDDHGHHKRK